MNPARCGPRAGNPVIPEFWAYLVVLIGILIAGNSIEKAEDGRDFFTADKVWLYATILTIGREDSSRDHSVWEGLALRLPPLNGRIQDIWRQGSSRSSAAAIDVEGRRSGVHLTTDSLRDLACVPEAHELRLG